MLTGVNLLLRFVGTSFQVYLSGKIGAAGIGLLQLVMSVGTLAMVAGIGGIRTATMYLTAEELGKGRPRNVCRIISGCLLYSIVISGSISFLLYHYAPLVAEKWIADGRTVSALRLYASFLPVCCLCAVMTGYFTAANRIGTLAAVEVAEQALSMSITMAALYLWAGTDPVKACLCVIFGSSLGACLTLLTLVILRVRENGGSSPPFPVRNRILRIAVPLAVADDLKSGINTIENLMVPKRLYLHSSADNPLAAFGLVSGMVFPIIMFPAAILFGLAELLIPELARCKAAGSSDRICYLVQKSLRVSLLYGLFLGGLVFLLSDELCLRLYKGSEAAASLRVYALLIPMLYCDAITDAMIKGLGQQKISVRYNILTSCMDVVLLYILLPKYGISGYFASFLITHLINFGLSLRRLLKITGQRLPILTPLACITAVAAAVLLCLSIRALFLRGICFVAIFGSLLTLLQILSKEDILWIKGLICKK